jgi:hypothetical protein
VFTIIPRNKDRISGISLQNVQDFPVIQALPILIRYMDQLMGCDVTKDKLTKLAHVQMPGEALIGE